MRMLILDTFLIFSEIIASSNELGGERKSVAVLFSRQIVTKGNFLKTFLISFTLLFTI